jgi:hypothetical protein
MTDQPAANDPAANDPAEVAQTTTTNLAAIMRLAADSDHGDLITYATSRRRKLYELLANSDDPLWKEIGAQLRDGQMQLQDMLGVDTYRTHLIDAIDKHGQDFGAALARTREQLEADQQTRPSPSDPPHRDA